MKRFAIAAFAEVVRKRLSADEANERVELSDAVLQRCTCASKQESARDLADEEGREKMDDEPDKHHRK